MIQNNILALTEYALKTGLIQPADRVYTINRLMELFELDELDAEEQSKEQELEEILESMLDYAADQGLIPENTITYRDLFDTKIMAVLMPRPSEVQETFYRLCKKEGAEAIRTTLTIIGITCHTYTVAGSRIDSGKAGLQTDIFGSTF